MRLPKWSALIIAAMSFSSSAFAAGVDSRAYTCDGLHSLVAANRFVFVNYPSFMDFVVANSSYCSGGEIIQLRSVPTSDKIKGRKRFRATLLGLDGQDVMIRADGTDIKFPFRAIANAKLVLTDKLINENSKTRNLAQQEK